MFHLKVLGGLSLDPVDERPLGRATQKRRLALLAVLAMAEGQRVRRDKLLALLWPECRDDEARQRLSTALYDLRRGLGEGVLGADVEEIWLHAGAVTVDAGDFSVACRAGDQERALALYAGPFLDGVHVDDAAEFEEWASLVRTRLDHEHDAALESRARALSSDGDLAGAAGAWQALADKKPHHDGAARGLVEALSSLGMRNAALDAGARYEAAVRDSLGAEPDAGVVELLSRLRAGQYPVLASGPILPATQPARMPDDASERLAGGAAFRGRSGLGPVSVPRRRLWRGAIVAAAALGVALFVAVRLRAPAPALSTSRVAVFPFAVHGGADHAYLSAGLVDLLTTSLDGTGVMTGVDPHAVMARAASGAPGVGAARAAARRLAAGRFVLGSVTSAGSLVRLQASLHDAIRDRKIGETFASGHVDQLPALVDSLSARLIAMHLGRPEQRLASTAALTTSSMPALRSYLLAEEHFRTGNFVLAAEGFATAAEADTSFALAHYRHALATLWANQPGASTDSADALARRHLARLSPRDRTLVEAYLAWRAGRADVAETLYRQVLRTHPDDVEAWHQLGETLFHYNPLRGRPVHESRAAFARVLAIDSVHWGAHWHLALLAGIEGKRGEFLERSSRLVAINPDRAAADQVVLLRTGLDDPHSSEWRAALQSVDDLSLSTLAWRFAVYFGNFDAAEAAYQAMRAPGRSTWFRLQAEMGLGELALARGRWDDAYRWWTGLEPSMAESGFERLTLGALLPTTQRSSRELRDLRATIERGVERFASRYGPATSSEHGFRFLIGLLDVASGDSSAARRAARALLEARYASGDPARLLAWGNTILAALEIRRGEAARALALLDYARVPFWYGTAATSPIWSQNVERFLRAQALEQLGREREALGWYAGFGEHAPHDLVFFGPALMRRAAIHEKLGETREAGALYARVATLWADADSSHRDYVRVARERLARYAPGDTIPRAGRTALISNGGR